MSAPARADTGQVGHRIRPILAAALAIASACGYAGPSAALAAHARGASGRAHHLPTCVGAKHRARHHTRKASYRNTHRAHHVVRCVWRHATHRTVKHHSHSQSPTHRRSTSGRAGGCADADLAPATWNVERIRGAVLCLVNRERAAQGEGALGQNARIEQAAQGHTESMAFGGYFEHVGPHGDTPVDRMRASGYIYSSQVGFEIGENLAWGTGAQGTPRAIVAAWMASPAHRANILDSRFRDTAVGVSPHVPSSLGAGHAGGIYTQDFGVIVTG
ncbi:MAG TPA: CAP domain-containing protein [Solirubrobacteraceae bacterium]|jgi:uncharacterized protein YkwD|nr:CAP domain-containing protein [Solirubrobacteraceae bacterium]